MAKILNTNRYRELLAKERKLEQIEQRLSDMYWLSEFTFTQRLANWLRTGYSKCGKFYNVGISDFRNEFRKEIEDYLADKEIYTRELKERIELLESKNKKLVEAFYLLKEEKEPCQRPAPLPVSGEGITRA